MDHQSVKKVSKSCSTVTLVIVNWNQRDLLIDCLQSVERQSLPADRIIVVDNGSTDGSAETVASLFSDVELLALPQNLGFAIANNIAIRQSHTKYVVLLNNDTFVEPDWLSNLVEAMETCPEAGMATSKMVYDHDPNVIDRAGDGYSIAGAGILRGRGAPLNDYHRHEKVFGACAGAAVYRKEMLDDIGLFDEDFFLINEDVDLSFRAQLAGYQSLFVPNAVVRHKASQTIGRDSDTSVYYGHRNLEWVYIKNMPTPLIAITLIPHLIYTFLAGAYFFRIGKDKVYLRAKKDALKSFKRIFAKRKRIQQNRRVGLMYLLKLFTIENPLTRLTTRRQNG